MNKIVFIIIIFFSIAFKTNAQKTEIDSIKLAGLCKVWGLVKNYHYAVIRKKVDWDKILIDRYYTLTKSNNFYYYNQQLLELLNSLPKEKSKIELTKKQCDLIIKNKIHELQNFSFLKDTIKYKNRISFSWINDEIFSDSVKDVLCNILINYKPKKNKYLKGDVVIKHVEDKYLELDTITEPYRILAIFRYWNIINYYFPYKHLMDKNWDTVLVEHINKIKNAYTYSKYINEFRKFTSNIDDSHGFYNYSTNKYYRSNINSNNLQKNNTKRGYIPCNFKIVNNNVIVSKILSDSTNIELGDTVLSINNINLEKYIKNYPKYNSVSTLQSSIMNIEMSLSRFYSSAFNLKIKRNNDTLNYIENGTVDSDTKTESFYRKRPFHFSINDSIGYIELTQIKLKEFNKTWKEFKNKKTIIFDLRGYPETSVWLMLPYLLSKDKKDVAEYYYPFKYYPGIFIKSKKNYSYWFWFVRPFVGFKKKYDKQIIVLINAETISQSETICMMFKAYSDNVTFIGEPTSGANGDIVKIDIPGGVYFYYSSLDWHFPSGEQLQRIGIYPDILVKRDIKSVIDNEDKVLNKAIEYAKKQ